MAKEEFLGLTWREYGWRCTGYSKKNEREWERYHWIVWNLMQPHQKKGSIKSFPTYLESLKPRPKLTEEQKEEKYRKALYLREKAEKLERFKNEQNR